MLCHKIKPKFHAKQNLLTKKDKMWRKRAKGMCLDDVLGYKKYPKKELLEFLTIKFELFTFWDRKKMCNFASHNN